MGGQTVDVVFEGGGAKGLALNGAACALLDAGYEFGRLVGTSAGAVTATLLAAGCTSAGLRKTSLAKTANGKSRMTDFKRTPTDFTDEELLSSTLAKFAEKLEPGFLRVLAGERAELALLRGLLKVDGFAHLFSMAERGGYYSADGFVEWLCEELEALGKGFSTITLGQLNARTNKHLTLVVTNSSLPSVAILNHLTAPDVPLVQAVRMSMSIPFFWPEVAWRPVWGKYSEKADIIDNAMVDGGVSSNFALRFLVSPEAWIAKVMDPTRADTQVLGLLLDDKIPVPNAPPPLDLIARMALHGIHFKTLDRIERIVGAALSANDMAEVQHYEELVCKLPAGGYGVTEFDMTEDRIKAIMDGGADAVTRWLGARGELKSVSDARNILLTAPIPA